MSMPSIQRNLTTRSDQLKLTRPLTPAEKDALIRSTIASMALEGLEVSYEEAAELLEDVLKRPLKPLA